MKLIISKIIRNLVSFLDKCLKENNRYFYLNIYFNEKKIINFDL